ncbi:MAG: hypothetical protein WCS22_04375 [Acholeplasmataceae bacterium]
MKCLTNMDRIQITNTLMMKLFKLYENKGRASYYKEFFERDDEVMAKQTIEDDTIALGEIFELNITPTRLRLLADFKKDYVPKNNDEKFLLNIKEALMKIQESAKEFVLNANEAIDLSTILYRGVGDVKLRKQATRSRSIVKTFEDHSSREQLEKLIEQYHSVRKSNKYEYLVIVANFYVDFIKIEPFNKYNEKIGLILIYTMLAKEFQVFRYESFFKVFKEYKERFGTALSQANYDWENGLSQTDSLIRIFVNVIEELNDLVRIKEHAYEFELTMNKSNSVEYMIYHGPSIFKKSDIREQLPLISESTINKTLQELRKKGIIRPLGKGRSSQWQRLEEKDRGFKPEQLSLFSD